MKEARAEFPCFGSRCAVLVMGGEAERAVAAARRRLLGWHQRFTRFAPTSELSQLNDDPRAAVPVSEDMARFAAALVAAAESTDGLVDGTLLHEIEAAGYRDDLEVPVPLAVALELAPPRRPAGPSAASRWREVAAGGDVVTRPPGVALDSGGIAKGLVADLIADELAGHESFAVDCAGDLRVGGRARPVHVASPFDGSTLHTFVLGDAGVATSGIGRRSWLDGDGAPAHHLLDPSTGRSAFTGVVQATAIAPTALEAEARAKAAVLAGPDAARAWLEHGGVLVYDDGRHDILAAA